MALYDMLNDRKPEPCAARSAAAARIGAIESAGEVRDLFGRNAFSFVGHGNPCLIAGRQIERNMHRAIMRAIFQRVVDQIAHHLFKLV